MHTKSPSIFLASRYSPTTMRARSGIHRHFVALPLLVLGCTAIVVVNAAMPLSASLPLSEFTTDISADETREISLGFGVSGTLEQGSVLRVHLDGLPATLVRGTVTLASEGFVELRLSDAISLISLDGAVTAMRDEQYSTIVALTSPVGVDTGINRYLLPSGYQLRIGTDTEQYATMSPVPSKWKEEALKHLPGLSVQVTSEEDPALELLTLFHADGRWTRERAQHLLGLAETLDTKGILPRLLALQLLTVTPPVDTEVGELLKAELLQELWTTEAFVLALPRQVLTTLHPVPSVLFEPWADQAIRFGLRDLETMTALIRETHMLPQKLEDAGYPIQSKQWEKALERVLIVLQGTAPNHGAEYQAFRTNLTMRVRPTFVASSTGPTFSSNSEIQEATLLLRTREMLRRREILVGGTTTLEVDSPNTVRVSSVFIPDQKRGIDIAYDFSFDPATTLLQNIVRNGEKLPNTVSEEVFFGH